MMIPHPLGGMGVHCNTDDDSVVCVTSTTKKHLKNAGKAHVKRSHCCRKDTRASNAARITSNIHYQYIASVGLLDANPETGNSVQSEHHKKTARKSL